MSVHAQRWLESLGAHRVRPPMDRDAIRDWIGTPESEWQECLVAFEERFGGLATTVASPSVYCGFYLGLEGMSPENARNLGIAVDREFNTRDVLGRPHLWIGGSEWILWFMDRDGHIAEVDDLGKTFYIADGADKRIEQLAIYESAADKNIERCNGLHGEAMARALGLVPLLAPSDAHQRYWATHDFTVDNEQAILVRESREPADYGVVERSDFTWVSAATRPLFEKAMGALPTDR
jgi:hypothetical protein